MLNRLEEFKDQLENDKCLLYDSVLNFCETGEHNLNIDELENLIAYIYKKELMIREAEKKIIECEFISSCLENDEILDFVDEEEEAKCQTKH